MCIPKYYSIILLFTWMESHSMCSFVSGFFCFTIMFVRFIMMLHVTVIFHFYYCIIFNCINIPQFIFPSSHWWLFGLFLLYDFSKQYCYEHSYRCFLPHISTYFSCIYSRPFVSVGFISMDSTNGGSKILGKKWMVVSVLNMYWLFSLSLFPEQYSIATIYIPLTLYWVF